MEGFLDKKYPDLAGSKPVERAVVKTRSDAERDFASHTREERITSYIDRLDYIIKDERGWRRLKQKLVNEFTIDTSDEDTLTKIAHGLYESEKRLAREQGRGGDIANLGEGSDLIRKYKDAIHEKHDIQERTLTAWLDYLKQNDAQYPMWFRYFVVRNLAKMGTLNKEKGEYSKRTDFTIAPFPELNSEALGFVYRMLTTGVGHQEFVFDPEHDAPEKENEIEKKRTQLVTLIEKRDFIKLYTFAQIETAGALNKESIQGEWVKYEQGGDHHILESALRNKGTGWCTAEGSAYAHLSGGDFYVYYTRGTHGTYSEPRIAIRMEGNSVAEVRGVNHRQELEPALVDIAQAQYHQLPGGEKFDKKSRDMRQVTELAMKQDRGEQFIKDDLRFIYELDTHIEGFGYERDPRIEEIKKKRNRKEDIQTLCDCPLEYIATDFIDINETTQVYCEDAGSKITFFDFREERNRMKLSQLIELAKNIKESGSLARPDMSFEGGIVDVEIEREKLKDLSTALTAYEDADNHSPSWIWNEWRKMKTYEAPREQHFDTIILSYNADEATRQSSDAIVADMERAGLRPATIAELIALGITHPECNKQKDVYLVGLGTKESLDGRLHVPLLGFGGGERRLPGSGWSGGWDGRCRFVCVRSPR